MIKKFCNLKLHWFSLQKQSSNWLIDWFNGLNTSISTFCELTTFSVVFETQQYNIKQKLVEYVPTKDRVEQKETIVKKEGQSTPSYQLTLEISNGLFE